MKKAKKIIIVIVSLLLIVGIGCFIYFNYLYDSNKLNIKEKEWINNNINKVVSFGIPANINNFSKNGSGVFIQRLTNDTSRFAEVFNGVLVMMSQIIKYNGILIALFIVNGLVFLYVLLMFVILYMLEKIRTDKYKKDDNVSRKADERVSRFIGIYKGF